MLRITMVRLRFRVSYELGSFFAHCLGVLTVQQSPPYYLSSKFLKNDMRDLSVMEEYATFDDDLKFSVDVVGEKRKSPRLNAKKKDSEVKSKPLIEKKQTKQKKAKKKAKKEAKTQKPARVDLNVKRKRETISDDYLALKEENKKLKIENENLRKKKPTSINATNTNASLDEKMLILDKMEIEAVHHMKMDLLQASLNSK